ncbi:hypothetical protein LY28_02342 [Ruminiclostridium sufflavum DSM 19573]|uniref:Uncharacterized protein n=1 Tax=Ruminiclostridium sufflavum DSM 19573 TaxID=1121337 RepID=A0A318XJM8_9FIRM|nr:hypothetical protein [Ruminiclostridium sufflavum]PYG87204.1 hypothetical protein LY28_02342 [Ruminiclostridium sufflavum DSM 19573]
MNKSEDIKTRLEDIKSYMYDEIHRLMQDNQELNATIRKTELDDRLQKFKPSKHKAAYKKNDKNLRRRCYLR